jgi:hypothetical protein
LSDLQPLEPLPAQWQLKSFAAKGAAKLQLDPEAGLVAELIVDAVGQQYRIVAAEKEIVTIDPPLTSELPAQTVVRKVTSFAPFDGASRNRQEHALYLGHAELLNIEAAVTIAVVGAQTLRTGVTWQYWGKVDPNDEAGWQSFTLAGVQQADALVLIKPKGAIDPRVIGGKSSRWIRGVTKHVPAGQQPFRPNELAIRVNAATCGQTVKCSDDTGESPAAEGMSNTTPLVLESTFFPLGREPRQFDAFYLGSVEAFSKTSADVQLCLEMADPTFATLSTVRGGGPSGNILAGVAADRALHLFELNATSGALEKFPHREALQPPLPGFNGQPEPGNAVALDSKPPWRLPMWIVASDLFVGTSAAANVWIWRERLNAPAISGWVSFGQVPATPSSAALIDGLVYLAGPGKLAALRDGVLSFRDLNGTQWIPVPTIDVANANAPVVLKSIVPILEETASHQLTSAGLGMVGVGSDKRIYEVAIDGHCTRLSPLGVDVDLRPVAVRRFTNPALVIALLQKTSNKIITFHSINGEAPLTLLAGENVLGFDAVISSSGELYFLATLAQGGVADLGSWTPPLQIANTQLFRAPIAANVGVPGGAPTALDHNVVIPGKNADVLVAGFDITQRLLLQADVEAGFVTPSSTPAFQQNDVVTLDIGPQGPFTRRRITQTATTKDGESFYPINQPFTPGSSGPIYGFHSTGPSLTGNLNHNNATLQLNTTDQQTVEGALLLSQNLIHRVTAINVITGNRFATLDPAPVANVANAHYWNSVPISGRLAPYMRPDAANNNWDAALLDHATLVFFGASPENQKGKAFAVGSGNRPTLIVLDDDWTAPPVPGLASPFVLDAAVGAWSRFLGDTSTNPELSWEYWNGKGWWKLGITFDETLNLKSSGALRFKVPDDINSSDWAGKTNYWIRARLVGGDYGREKVTVKSKDLGGGVSEQTVERSSADVRAPSVVKLHISYQLCDGVNPVFVLAQDSGSIRDQSDANRTRGAIVEAFVPLDVAMGRLAGSIASPKDAPECPPECDCQSASIAATPSPTLVASAQATGRALYIGLNAALSGAPVNVLLLVDKESPYEQFAPMKIEALVADRFVPLVVDDATRAMGESGLLSMSFSVEPTPRELFGMENLTWLRFTPGGSGPVDEWKPAIRGAYLNAVWAIAAETLTRELLGSSEGAPDMTFFLARPPLLSGTLELRVKEPLGDEERTALLEGDETRVLSAVDGLPGDWVLWERVTDPGDASAKARVYALDESNGEIRFGDGQHGRIPPIGRDSIVAFSYKRTELGKPGSDSVPANSITARTALNLVSPVESVEAVFAADQAAGGAPPESDERVLRFGTARMRHRSRAVTAHDFEDLALESSPDIVQARCFVRPGQVRLVVVMRGENPLPNAAQVRELSRLLLAAAPASLSVSDAFRITGPRIRRLRVVLELRVASLDYAGDVSRTVLQRVTALFDTAMGGANQEGWPMGETPAEDDIARALIDTRHLEGLGVVTLREVLPDGTERPWTGAMKRDELVMLDKDAVRLQFETVEVIA